jgi:2-polyprenyl-3-methyl-5-hydroxy-6-metoxy-1,4-benzoquinol methylase
MSVPNYGEIAGQWDLRGCEHQYLGDVAFAGKRVLEVGTASGHLCFWMERQGADVVAFDLDETKDWDLVPFATQNYERLLGERR